MSKSIKNDESKEAKYSLKAIELQMIQNMHDRANSALFDYLSFVAIERLAYTPNKGTTFRVENGALYIGDTPIPEEPKEEVAVS